MQTDFFSESLHFFSGMLSFQQLQLLRNGGGGAALHPMKPQLLFLAPLEKLASGNIYVRLLPYSCSQHMTAVNLCFIQLFMFLSAVTNKSFRGIPIFSERKVLSFGLDNEISLALLGLSSCQKSIAKLCCRFI